MREALDVMKWLREVAGTLAEPAKDGHPPKDVHPFEWNTPTGPRRQSHYVTKEERHKYANRLLLPLHLTSRPQVQLQKAANRGSTKLRSLL